MAENIIDGVEYESEPHPGYEIDGKPVYYAKNVPDLLRGNVTLSPMRQWYADRLDEMPHMERAARGRLAWNLWVNATVDRWLTQAVHNAKTHVCLLPVDINLIDFTEGLEASEEGRFEITVGNFDGFVFPCTTSFKNGAFLGGAWFGGVAFSGDAWFDGVIFSDDAWFSEATFSGEVRFTRSTFLGDTWLEGIIFSDEARFSRATFSGVASFDRTIFSRESSFGGATFADEVWFSQAIFSGTTWFGGAIFSNAVSFIDVVFSDGVWFDGAKFKSAASYHRAVFLDGARWYDAEFAKTVRWNDVSFWAAATFENSRFNAAVDLDGASFGQTVKPPRPEAYGDWPDTVKQAFDNVPLVTANSRTIPNFKGANFLVAPNLGYTKVAVPEHKYLAWYEHFFAEDGLKARPIAVSDKDAASKMRRLQELAKAGHHSYAERQFFRAELLCRRGHETKSWREIQLIWGFEAFSECGSAIVRPLLWWGGGVCVFFAIYGRIAGVLDTQISWDEAIHLFNYTFSNGTPLLGVIKTGDSGAIHALFGGKLPPLVALLGGVHNLLSTAFIFFALLGVRNYFKVS